MTYKRHAIEVRKKTNEGERNKRMFEVKRKEVKRTD
jgi:hypothetical protein